MRSEEVSSGGIGLSSVEAPMEQAVVRNRLAIGLTPSELGRLNELSVPRMVKRGGYLAHAGDGFRALYLVERGVLKGAMMAVDGREQVVAFYLPGEPVGAEGIGSRMNDHDVVALEDSRVRGFPFDALERLSRTLPLLQRNVNRILSGEIVRNQGLIQLLGNMRAEQRVALVLLNISRRLKALGLSATLIDLHITRRDLGSYIGLCLETVSRELSRLESRNLIALRGKCIELLDSAALEHLVHGIEPQLRKVHIRPATLAQSTAAFRG